MNTFYALIVVTFLVRALAFQGAFAEDTKGVAPVVDQTSPPQTPAVISQREPDKSPADNSIQSYTSERRGEAVKRAKSSLDALDERMEKLGDRMKERKRKTLRELEGDRKELGKRYGELKHATKDTWEDVKKRFVDALRELEQKFEAAEEKQDGAGR